VPLREEILEQPEAAARLLSRQAGAIDDLAAAIRDRGVRHVVIVARGSSDHAAIYAQYVLGIRHGLTVGLATPSVVSVYGGDPDVSGALVIAISQSGASPDIITVLEAARRHGALTVALTNDAASPLAAAAERTIDLSAGPERSIAATKSYTTSLLAVAALSAALTDDAADRAVVAAIPETLAAVLTVEPAMREAAEAQAAADRALIVARGYEYATAREWSIKVKELAHVFADPYSAADFAHGPVALIEAGVPLIAIVRDGPTADGLIAQLTTLRQDLAPDLTVVSDRADALALATRPVAVPTVPAEWVAPIATIVAGQFHAMYLTIARGRDPENPRSISKVTRTR
jgi:glucosamine--fructose-6-phosphate aminotransferase (isomerizing)